MKVTGGRRGASRRRQKAVGCLCRNEKKENSPEERRGTELTFRKVEPPPGNRTTPLESVLPALSPAFM